MKIRYKRIEVHPEFANLLKSTAYKKGKRMRDFTKELAEENEEKKPNWTFKI